MSLGWLKLTIRKTRRPDYNVRGHYLGTLVEKVKGAGMCPSGAFLKA